MQLFWLLFRQNHPFGVNLLSIHDEGVEEHACSEFSAIDGNAIHAWSDRETPELLARHVEDADSGIRGIVGQREADKGLLLERVGIVLIKPVDIRCLLMIYTRGAAGLAHSAALY